MNLSQIKVGASVRPIRNSLPRKVAAVGLVTLAASCFGLSSIAQAAPKAASPQTSPCFICTPTPTPTPTPTQTPTVVPSPTPTATPILSPTPTPTPTPTPSPTPTPTPSPTATRSEEHTSELQS